jgi:peptidyl-dipeptidase A
MESAEEFVGEKAEEFLELYKNLCAAYWSATLSGKEEEYKKSAEKEIELKKFFNNREEFEKVKNFCAKPHGPLLERQLKLLYDAYLSNQGEVGLLEEISKRSNELEKKFNTFRGEISGKKVSDNEIKEILRKETDSSKLEEAWSAFKKVGEVVAEEVLEVVRLRNRLAKSLGFENYYEFSLEVSEQKEADVLKIFDELDVMTRGPFTELKKEIDEKMIGRFGVKPGELKPWHYGDPFFQEGPQIYSVDLDKFYEGDILQKAIKYYDSLGMEVRDILERSSLYAAEGKYQHAYCINMDRFGDIRTMQNLDNSEKEMETLLHELGHGVYWKYMGLELPIILRDTAHTFVTEAIAMLFGRKARSLEFIQRCCDEAADESLRGEISRALRLRQLVFSRWVQVMFRFERAMYKNPEQDLNYLWWRLVQEYQLVDFARDRPDWASKIHLVSSPVYYHNYMLGELLASQLHNYILQNITKDERGEAYFGQKSVGEFLKENIFRQGAKYPWNELVEKATGEGLTARYFVKDFC